MDLFSAERQAKLLMAAHGLTGWKFEWSNTKRSFGDCHSGKKTIRLSSILTPQVSEDSVRNTMLHEIAHALVGTHHDHDAVWRRKALEIGASGERCGSEKVELEYKWHGICPSGHIFKRHRKVKGPTSCNRCSPNGFSARFMIRWTAAY